MLNDDAKRLDRMIQGSEASLRRAAKRYNAIRGRFQPHRASEPVNPPDSSAADRKDACSALRALGCTSEEAKRLVQAAIGQGARGLAEITKIALKIRRSNA